MDEFPKGMGPEEALELTKMAFQQLSQNVGGADLRDLFQIVVGEMYIRSETDETWEEQWHLASESVKEMFNPDTTPDPEVLADYTDAREELNEARARRFDNAFADEATMELKAMFDKHGVVPDVDGDDQTPGQYL